MPIVAACNRTQGPRFLNQALDVEYVGSGECRSCHLDKSATYAQTGMGRSWYPMTPEVAVEDFHHDNTIEIAPTGLRYRMEQRDGQYYMRQFMLDSRAREIAVDERRLVWAVGSNNHNRGYLVLVDDKLFQAPVCWYPNAALWDLCPGFEHENNHFTRAIRTTCVFCHNDRMEPLPGAVNEYREPIPHGIGCERCHGPGELHVARWRGSGDMPTGEIDPTIVNPRRLPLEQRIQVCFQCHLGDSKATERVFRRERSLIDFRPGLDLTEVMVPFHYKEQMQDDFGLSAQADRLLLSRCYQESGGKIECLTCHNPHISVYSPDRPPDMFRNKCLGCHAVEGCTEEHASRQSTRGLPDDCVACHMRRAEPDDQRFTTFTDHWIRSTIEPSGRHERDSLELEPVFPELHAAFSPAEQAFYRGRADMLLSLKFPDPKRRGMWESAAGSFQTAIETGLDTADSWFFRGKVLTYLRRQDEAEQAFRHALERDSGHYDAAFALGQALGGRGAAAEATEVFRKLVDRHPDNAGALAELGRFRLMAGELEPAIELYGRAIDSEPWHASLHLNRGRALARFGRLDEAVRDAEEAVRLDPDKPDAWEFYGSVMAAAGRRDDAAEGARLFRRLRDAVASETAPGRSHQAPAPAPGSAAPD